MGGGGASNGGGGCVVLILFFVLFFNYGEALCPFRLCRTLNKNKTGRGIRTFKLESL